jgi:pimeloyl-ACP methyl ester carboxylesterase
MGTPHSVNKCFISTEFGEIFAAAAGVPAQPLVLGLHGWSKRNGWHTWEPLLLPLAAAGYYAVSVDMPGWGQSVPKQQETMTRETAVRAVTAVLDGLGHRQAALMGKSWGGGIALSLALAHPERVTKLILTAPAFRELHELPNLQQPVLLTWAENDPVIPFRYAAQFAQAITNCTLVTYPTGEHSAAQKNVAAFAPKAVQFLDQ